MDNYIPTPTIGQDDIYLLSQLPFEQMFVGMLVLGAEYITIGSNTVFNVYCVLGARPEGRIVIGHNVLIGDHVTINAGMHNFVRTDIPICEQGMTGKPIIIGNDVWIGSHCTILAGAKIPDGCVIGAGSVVTSGKKLRPYCVYQGAPLQQINERR